MNKSNFFNNTHKPLLFAHRGCSYAAPENTIAAFRMARDQGIPGVELDVRICATGEMVVFHDDDFERIFGRSGTIESSSLKEIRQLDAGKHKGKEYEGEMVPLLTEVLELLGKEIYYDIEIKNRNKTPGKLGEVLLKIIREYNLEDKCIVSSFNPVSMKDFIKRAPDIPGAIIYSRHKDVPFYLRRGQGRLAGTPILKPDHEMVTKNFFLLNSRLLGYPVLPWTVDDPARAKELLQLGASGIISNRPEDLIHLFRDKKSPPV